VAKIVIVKRDEKAATQNLTLAIEKDLLLAGRRIFP
jgi:hypothetical protein